MLFNIWVIGFFLLYLFIDFHKNMTIYVLMKKKFPIPIKLREYMVLYYLILSTYSYYNKSGYQFGWFQKILNLMNKICAQK